MSIKSPEDFLNGDESVLRFADCMRDFNQMFNDMIVSGAEDFTIRLEVHGSKGKMNHCRNYQDYFRRPPKKGKS